MSLCAILVELVSLDWTKKEIQLGLNFLFLIIIVIFINEIILFFIFFYFRENSVNYHWFNVELAPSLKAMLDNWNCCINRWLRYCLNILFYFCLNFYFFLKDSYERLMADADDEKGKRTFTHRYRGIITFMLSALWHV